MGEWRLLTRDADWSNVWASEDFRSLTHLGPMPGFIQGACPSFFPLPRAYPGAGPGPAGADAPTHVYLVGDTTLKPTADAHRTVLVAGTYEEKGKGVLGSWTATKGIAKGKRRRPVARPA